MFVVPSCPAIFDTSKAKEQQTTTVNKFALVPTALMTIYIFKCRSCIVLTQLNAAKTN